MSHTAQPVDDAVEYRRAEPESMVDARTRVAHARRIVIKIGTNVIMRKDGGLAIGRLFGLLESIAMLRRAGREVLVVSSGAVGLGAARLALEDRPASLMLKQACAAVGQGRLMALYSDAFDRLGMACAQVLLTENDFVDAERYHNLRATLDTLLKLGVVPVLNENDTVSTVELERPGETGTTRATVFGDNDRLSALIAGKINADLLVILSDVDGLFTKNPTQSADAELVPVVYRITPELLATADGRGARGRGGMATKLQAAQLASVAGALVVIANGHLTAVVDRVCAGEALGTIVLPEEVAV
jgi:glutamate 5-kinase